MRLWTAQGFVEVFLSPCSNFHDRIIPVFDAVLPEGLTITGFLSLDSQNLLMILCTVADIPFPPIHKKENLLEYEYKHKHPHTRDLIYENSSANDPVLIIILMLSANEVNDDI